jgi:hypothetical protein
LSAPLSTLTFFAEASNLARHSIYHNGTGAEFLRRIPQSAIEISSFPTSPFRRHSEKLAIACVPVLRRMAGWSLDSVDVTPITFLQDCYHSYIGVTPE